MSIPFIAGGRRIMEKKGKIKINFRLKVLLAISLVCLFILSIASSAFAQKKRISIGGAPKGGIYYPFAVGMAEVINKFLPDYNAIAVETGGATENLRLLAKGEIQIGQANIREGARAYRGEDPFTTPLKNIRVGFHIGAILLHVVTLEKFKIKTLEDLKGKIVNLGPPGSTVPPIMETLLGLHNISIKDLKVRRIGVSEAMEAMADGLIDAACFYSALPAPALMSLAVRQKVRLITCDQKILNAVESKENALCYYVPPQTYKGQDEGAFLWAFIGTTNYNEATSTEDVYKWTKAIIEQKDIIQKIHPQGKEIRLVTKKEFEISPVPLHPGVIKYAKEVGISY